MKKIPFPLFVLVVVALLLFPVSTLAAGPDGVMKVDSKRPVTIDREYRVAGKALLPGEYRVQHQVADSGEHFAHFVPVGKKTAALVVPVQCEMEPSGEKIKLTRADAVDENGVRTMRKLRVAGNNAAFVFE